MNPFPLAVRRYRRPGSVDAWLLGGHDASAWLETLCALGGPLNEVVLYPIGDRAAVAVGVRNREHVHGLQATALTRVGSRLLIPADARLDPPVLPSELDRLLTLPTYLLHPVLGFVGFEAADAIGVGQLLAPPPPSEVRWDRAVAGTALRPLRSVRQQPRPVLRMLFEEGGGDIGSRGGQSLPPAPHETEPDSLKARFARRVLDFTKKVPATGDKATWVNRLEAWANRVLGQNVQNQREREMQRLLHLLENDPDQGLRFALPLHGAGGRGVAPPGGSLSERDVDFSIDGLGGGGPVDAWGMDPAVHAALERRYRELAERELTLGRHRRAAYILAQLLGDDRGAAGALESGGHWREAAAMYRQRCHDHAAAARCLERGGMLSEALDEYRSVQDLPKVAEILEKLRRDEEARRVHRQIVDRYLERDDRLGAAKWLDSKLGELGEAIEVLRNAWPGSRQAEPCLREYFELSARDGRHRAAAQWIIENTEFAGHAPALCRVLSRVSRSYPDGDVRALAADRVRVVVGTRLERASDADRAQLLRALRDTDREDRLLARDATRVQQRLARSTRKPPPRSTGGSVDLVREFKLLLPVGRWSAFGGSPDGLLGLSHDPKTSRAVLHRVPWTGGVPDPTWHWDRARNEPWSMLPPIGHARNVRVFGASVRLDDLERTSADGRLWRAGTPSWWPDRALGACHAQGRIIWVLEHAATDSVVLRCFSASGEPLRSVAVPGAAVAENAFPVPIVAIGKSVCFALGTDLWIHRDGGAAEPAPRPGGDFERIALVRSPELTAERVVSALGDYGCELWTRLDSASPDCVRFAEDLEAPAVTFCASGAIVVGTARSVAVYRTTGGRVQLAVQRGWELGDLLALVPGLRTDEFGAVCADGVVRLYRTG